MAEGIRQCTFEAFKLGYLGRETHLLLLRRVRMLEIGQRVKGGNDSKKGPCFWFHRLHQVRDCPDNKRLSALADMLGETSGNDVASARSTILVNRHVQRMKAVMWYGHSCIGVMQMSQEPKPNRERGKAPMTLIAAVRSHIVATIAEKDCRRWMWGKTS